MRKQLAQLEDAFDKAKLNFKRRFGLIDPVIILPYRGYAYQNRAHIGGRLLEKEGALKEGQTDEKSFLQRLAIHYRRYESDEIPFQTIIARFQGQELKTQTDEEGFFEFDFQLDEPIRSSQNWLEIELEAPPTPYYTEPLHATGEIQLVPEDSQFGIISDVDDTIIKSFANSSLKKIRTLLSNTAKTRTPFPHVGDFYRAMQQARGEYNPLFFVSGSSWNLYDFLVDFCDAHDIPKGTFFLRELGLSKDLFIKEETTKYKQEHLKTILDFFPRLAFILIGDSGQEDPEIYLELAKKYPKRVKAVYIRNITSAERKQEVQQLADQIDELGIPMLLIDDTKEAAEHARQNGWISAEAMKEF